MSSNTHHILPLRVYYMVAGALLFMTLLTVEVARFDFGEWNMVVAMLIAMFKASLVVLFFMHLLYDNKFYGLVFVSAILFLGIFIILTMFDTMARGEVNKETHGPISPYAAIYDSTGQVINKGSHEGSKEGSASETSESSHGKLSDFEMKNGVGPFDKEVEVGPIDQQLADKGQEIFKTKCITCHQLDNRVVGPPLREVTERRTPTYIMNMIMNPDEMAKVHPTAEKLRSEYQTIMTFQNVTEDDARALLEYLRRADEQAKK